MKYWQLGETVMAEQQIINAPAPWELEGTGYICFLRCPRDLLDHQSFVPTSLSKEKQDNTLSLLIFVDYLHSPVGPYRELLFIPGRFRFADGLQHLSISRIFVSSMDSVINGRRNWGIPKEVADFEVTNEQNLDHVTVTQKEKNVAELTFRSWPVALPFSSFLLPTAWHTLAQYTVGRTFIFSPKARGLLRPARLVEAHINPTEFPPIKTEQVVAAIKISHFKMYFPVAKVLNKG